MTEQERLDNLGKTAAIHIHEQVNSPSASVKRIIFITALALVNAIIVGGIAKLLVLLIGLFTNIFFFGDFSFHESSPADNTLGYTVIAIPVIGGLLVGLMAKFGSRAIRGHGIPEAMEKIVTEESKIHPMITILKPLSAAISIGTGGPFGAEGPIISTGGALGSFCGQTLHITAQERKILLAAGATAGMTAIFGTPFAAILLAIELLLFEFSAKSFLPVMIACITGACMHFILFSSSPTFPMPQVPPVNSLAVVAYDYAAAAMHIEHKQNGLLAPFGDTEQFLRRVSGLASDLNQMRRLGAAARETVLRHNWEDVSGVFEHYLHQAMQGGRNE